MNEINRSLRYFVNGCLLSVGLSVALASIKTATYYTHHLGNKAYLKEKTREILVEKGIQELTEDRLAGNGIETFLQLPDGRRAYLKVDNIGLEKSLEKKDGPMIFDSYPQ